jgi:hypothetical protein
MKTISDFKSSGVSLSELQKLFENYKSSNFDIMFGNILDLNSRIYIKHFCIHIISSINLHDYEKFIYDSELNLFTYQEKFANVNIMDNKRYRCFSDLMNRFYNDIDSVIQTSSDEYKMNLENIKKKQKQIKVLEQGTLNLNINKSKSDISYGKFLTSRYQVHFDYLNKEYLFEFYGRDDDLFGEYDNLTQNEINELKDDTIYNLNKSIECFTEEEKLQINKLSELKKTKEKLLNLYSEFLI